MLEKNNLATKNIQEAKVITKNIDGIFKYFDSLKDLLPQIKSPDSVEDPEIEEMLVILGSNKQ